MPRLTQPPIPAALEKAARVLGVNSTKIAILHQLALRPGSTIGDLTSALGLGPATIHAHLRTLEADGVIYTDHPADDRAGRRVRYSSDQETLRQYLQNVAQHIAPTGDDAR